MKTTLFSKAYALFCVIIVFSHFSTEVQAQTSFEDYFQDEFSSIMYLYDSTMTNPSSPMGPYPYVEEEESKQQSKFLRQREKFYPYGNLQAAKKADSLLVARINGGSCTTGNWKAVGPIGDPVPAYNTPPNALYQANKNGRLDCIAFKPGDTSIVYVGSGGGGGLWKVNITNGTSQNMNTDRISLHTGVGSVVAIPGRVIVATGKSLGRVYWNEWEFSCTGIYYTNNEGASWTRATVTDKNSKDPFGYGEDKKQWVSKIAVHPTDPDIMFMTVYNVNVIFAGDEKEFGGLFKSTDGGVTWNEINDNNLTNRYFKDIEFNPVHPDTIYVGSHNLYRSLDGGSSWADITSVLTGAPTRPSAQLFWTSHEKLIAVPAEGCDPADGDNVVVFASEDQNHENNWKLYHSTDALSSNLSSIINTSQRSRIEWASPFHGGFTMSRHPDTLYIGGRIVQASYDGGANISTNLAYWNGIIHADIQQILTQPFSGSNGNVVMVCTDGGLYRSNDYGNSFQSLNNGLGVTEFYGLGVSQTDNTVIAGAQDNYNMFKDNNGIWKGLFIGDGSRYAAINSNNTSEYAFADIQDKGEVIFNGGTTINMVNSLDHPPFMFQHNHPSRLLAASDRMYFVTNGTETTSATFKSSLGADSVYWVNGLNAANAFAYSYSNPDIIYVATTGQIKDSHGNLVGKDPNVDYGDPLNYTTFNLFKTTDGGATWNNISTMFTGFTGYISSIALHPINPDTLWMTFSGYATKSLGNQNVVVSHDGGSTWSHYDTGLPLGSTKDIVYQHGSNNLLYVALESGVYYRDRTMSSWQCMDNGLPITNITDLEISYCSGKLYASTFGRGSWATDLLNHNVPGVVETINTNTIWNTSRYLTGDVLVKPGVTLTISGGATTIKMPKNGIIKVDSGAYLIVDSATITNGCDTCMWEGIQVGGRYNVGQLTNLQGRIWLKDATIENAKNAISNKFEGYLWNTGGIIRADRTKFINNSRSVVLMNYTSTAKYAASFRQCTFNMTNEFKGGAANYFQAHVDLNRTDGASFYGCNFYNRFTDQYRCEGYGIRARDAGFSVKHHCASTLTNPCTDYVRSNFKGFLYGVYADRTIEGAYSFTVDRATFDSCSFGIRMYNIWGIPVVTRDSFHVGHGIDSYIGFDCHRNVGIFATACGGYVIQDNDFKGYKDIGWQHNQHENWGTLVEDGGELDNQIYRCSFRELNRGNVSWGKNAAPYNYATSTSGSTWTGLRYICNGFTDDTTDIHVQGSNYRGGIAAWQGDFAKPAGNSFGSSSHNHIKIVGTPYPFYFYQNSGTQNPTAPTPGYLNKTTVSSANSCPVLTDDWNVPLGSGTKTDIKNGFYGGRIALTDLQTTYSGYIDGGNTATLLSYIDGSTSGDATTVKATLLSYSPFVSTTALKALAAKDILMPADLMDILTANPDVLRYPDLINYLHSEIPTPLDDGYVSALITASHDSSARTVIEANMSKQAAYNQLLASFLLADMQLDSANTDIDSIPVWYDNLNSLSAEYAKVGYYTGRADYTNAVSVLDGIASKFSLTEEESTELENYVDFWTILKDVKLDGRNFHELTGTEVTNLLAIKEGTTTNDRVNVGTTVVVGSPPDDPIRLPCIQSGFNEWTKQGVTSNYQNSKKRTESIKIVRVYPNPADDKVTFDYTFPANITGSLNLVVTNIVGQKMKEIPLKDASGNVQWDTRAIPAGVYIYKIYDRKNTVETGKLVISR